MVKKGNTEVYACKSNNYKACTNTVEYILGVEKNIDLIKKVEIEFQEKILKDLNIENANIKFLFSEKMKCNIPTKRLKDLSGENSSPVYMIFWNINFPFTGKNMIIKRLAYELRHIYLLKNDFKAYTNEKKH